MAAAHTPLISVTLPNYNYGRFLAQALETVLMQTYGNFEILLTDDGSTDDSREIARRFAAQDSRVKVVYFEQNQGALAAHADTWSRVSGEIVYQYSSDDCVHDPDFFRLGVEALNAHPQAAGFFGAAAMIAAEDDRFLGYMGRGSTGFIDPHSFLRGFLSAGFFVPGISSLWRRREIDAVGGYDRRLGPQTDYFINHALPARSGVVFMPRHFANARVSTGRQSFSSSTTLQADLSRLALFASKLRENTRNLGDFRSDWENWRKQQAIQLLSKHESALAGVRPS